MTEFEFRESPEMRTELEGLLGSKIMQFALGIVEERAKPRSIPQPRMHSHLDTLTSQTYFQIAGIQQAVDCLKRLTRPNPQKMEDESVSKAAQLPFFNSLPKEMQDAMLERENAEGNAGLV